MDAPDRLLADLEKEIDDTGFAAKRGVDHIRAVKLGSNGKFLSLSSRFVSLYLTKNPMILQDDGYVITPV